MENIQKLKREQAILKGQLDTLNGRLMAGERSLRPQVAAVSRQLGKIEARVKALTGDQTAET